MKLILILLLAFSAVFVSAQTPFWTEDFGAGCNAGQLATAYSGPNGAWTSTNTGTNQSSANVWYVSATENGNPAGACGTGCGSDQTLHLGSVSVLGLPADLGAAYYEGVAAFCGFFPCGGTSRRAESPAINASSYTSLSVSFVYMEGGNAIDNATMWYFNGSAWALLMDLPKTALTCSPQGIWTTYSVNLPASANNNGNIRIGFQWINNDDGDATDPSFAVDDIVVSGILAGADTTPPVLLCPPAQTIGLSGACSAAVPNLVPLATVSDNVTANPVVTQSPAAGAVITSSTVVTLTALDGAGNTTTCTTTVNVADQMPPSITCAGNVNVDVGAGCTATIPAATANVTVGDNCTAVGSIAIQQSPPAGTVINATTLVTVTATDAAGNASSCSYSVVPVDAVPFTVVCPPSVTVSATGGQTSANVTIPLPTFTDNCATSATYVNTFNGGANASGSYPLGTTQVTYTATANTGEVATCSFSITVIGSACCPADLNCDGYIGVSDLLIFNANFGCATGCAGDINDDGLVSVDDLVLFTAQFGTNCP
ncbi:MAG: HYR domain-containing protein [Flavobacteriales bacterium]